MTTASLQHCSWLVLRSNADTIGKIYSVLQHAREGFVTPKLSVRRQAKQIVKLQLSC